MGLSYQKMIHKALILGTFALVPFALCASDVSFVTGVLQDEAAQNHTMGASKEHPFRNVYSDYRGMGPYSKDVRLDYSARVFQTTSMGVSLDEPHDGPAHFVYPAGKSDIEHTRAVNAFASVYGPFSLIEGDIQYLAEQYPHDPLIQGALSAWQGQNGWRAIYVNPHDDTGLDNAYYSRTEKGHREINFFMMSSPNYRDIPGDKSTADGSDVPAHEAGHAILDLLWKELFDQPFVSAGAIHEGWGDWMAVSWTLHQRNLCESLVQETVGKLSIGTFLNKIAEEFGGNFGDPDGLRFLEKDLHISKAKGQVHAASLVLSGAWWDILKGGYEALSNRVDSGELDPGTQRRYQESPAEMLYDAGQYFRRLLVESVVRADKNMSTFSEVGRSLFETASRRSMAFDPVMTSLPWTALIQAEFTKRGIWYDDPRATENELRLENYLTEEAGKAKSICHTLGQCVAARQNPKKHSDAVEEKIKGKALLKQRDQQKR